MTSKIVLPVAVVLSVILGVLTWQIQSRTSSAIEHIANRELTALGAQYGNYIRDFLGVAIDEAGALAGGLSQALQEGRTISRDTLIAMQTGIHADSATLYGCGTMWEPNAFDGRDAEFRGATGSTAEGRFLPYCAQDAPVTDLGGSITEAYYSVPQKTGKPFLSDPTDYNSNGTIIAMSTASYPVMVDGRFRGTVVADISLAQLDELITGIDVYSTGYAGLLTADGLVVAHKEHGLIGKNLFDVNRFVSPEQARSAFQAGRTYMEEATTKDGDFIRYYQPISLRDTGQNWYVALVVPLEEVMAEANAIRNVTLGLCGVTLLLMLGVIFILVRSAVAPINYLAKTAEIIAGGNLKQPIEDSRFGGELKQLSSSLKNMIASLIEGIDKAQALSEEAKAESLKAREAMQAAEAAEREARDKTERMLTAADKLEAGDTDLSAERDAATFGVCLGAIQAGANIVRVHDAAGFAQFLNGYWAVAKPQPRRAFVAVGSNLGHRCDNIRAARDMIAEIPLTCVSNSSKIYESEPAYETRQDAFANAVIEIKTELAPLVLLDELMKIEAELGRDRSKKAKANGPRTIDLDLLWMDGETHGGKKLRLPHPLIGERDFVLVPLEDLMHDPARFFRYNGVEVKEPEDRVGHIVGELGRM